MRSHPLPAAVLAFAAAVSSAPAASAQCQFQGLRPQQTLSQDFFGKHTEIDGTTAMVGAFGHNSGRPGRIVVYEFDGSQWSETQVLVPSDGGGNDQFGNSVGLDGDLAIGGSEFHSGAGGSKSGAAYVFERQGGTWVEIQKLEPDDAYAQQNFAEFVDISGDYALCGARFDSDFGNKSGAAYMFERQGGVYVQVAKLTASDAERNDLYGDALAVDGETAVIGAWREDSAGSNAGAAYVYVRQGGVWTETQKLTGAGGEFGRAIGLDGDRLLVTAWQQGMLHFYERSPGGPFVKVAEITTNDGSSGDRLGHACGLSGDFAAVGAHYDSPHGTRSGSGYIFERVAGTWMQRAKVVPDTVNGADQFGHGADISGDWAIFGAYTKEGGGAAYMYAVENGCDTGPVADFSATPLSGDAPLMVQFTDESENAASWDWDFGDGNVSTDQNPSHTYTMDGSYTVSLTVGDGMGDEDTFTRQSYIQVGGIVGVEPYGCGVNPDGSLLILSGTPQIGTTIVFGIDNPVGTQAPGSAPLLALSWMPDPAFPCGTLVANRGMAGAGADGERLIMLPPFKTYVGPGWQGPGMPVAIPVALPNSMALIGREIFAQGRLFDMQAAQGVSIGLTGAIKLTPQP